MSYDINRITLIGRLSKDPELKYTPSGTAVANFGLAVGGRPKPDGTPTVSFFNIVVWGKVAENCANYLSKGKQAALDGHLEQRCWTAKDGSKHSVVDVIAERIEFLASPQGEKGQENGQPTEKEGKQKCIDTWDNKAWETPLRMILIFRIRIMAYHCRITSKECDGCGLCEIDTQAESEAREIEEDRLFDEERDEAMIAELSNRR